MTVKLQNGNVILKDGRVSCECCGCPYEFDLFTLLRASQRQINFGDNSLWPEDVTVSAWTLIATIDEEPAPPFPNWQRDRQHYRRDLFKPKYQPGRETGSCARFVCARSKNINSMEAYGGPTTTGRDLRALIAKYVPAAIWEKRKNNLFKIEFYGWEQISPVANGTRYNFVAPSDTYFTIKHATFTINE